MSSRCSTGDNGIPRIRGLEHRFACPDLLRRALTHRSIGHDNNERLEFLGDAVLNCVAAELLFRQRPDVSEGDLSRMRSRLVRERTLAELAAELELGEVLRLGAGELRSGGHLRASILADALEAVIGAIFVDAGYAAAARFVTAHLQPRIDALPDADALKDAKTRLQELLQARGCALPVYELIETSGAEHARSFRVRCRVEPLASPVEASAGSRRKAEQAAARAALDALGSRA